MSAESLSKQEIADLYRDIYAKADKIIERLLAVMFLFGIFIAFFYDTWLVALGVGSLCIAAYFIAKKLLPGSTLYQYVLSSVCTILAAQYIYQMHGMAEMHFWVFISATALIIYQNWKLQIPMILIVYVHHGSFAWLQYAGYEQVYFTQLEYMDLTTFLFHAILATGVCTVAGLWSYTIHNRTVQEAQNFKNLSALQLELKAINEKLNQMVDARTEALTHQNKRLLEHAFINAHKVRSPLARIMGLVNLIGREVKLDQNSSELLGHLTHSATELDKVLNEVRINLEGAEFRE